MEYVRGRNLRQFAEQSHPTARESAAIVASVARALNAAHRMGVVHQDIKPLNILIDEDGKPRLIDFGLAQLEQAWSDSIRPLGGTVSYMSPEQARAYRHPDNRSSKSALDGADRVGPASDLFSLGAVLYFLLTGRAPYTGGESEDLVNRACRGEWDRAPAARRQGIETGSDSQAGDGPGATNPVRERRGAGGGPPALPSSSAHDQTPRRSHRGLVGGGGGTDRGMAVGTSVDSPYAAGGGMDGSGAENTWGTEGDYSVVRVSQLHVQNAAGRPCRLRATLQQSGFGAASAATPVHGDYAFTPGDDNADLENIKVLLPHNQLGIRPGETRSFHYTLDLFDSATMRRISSAPTAGEIRITEFPIARLTALNVPVPRPRVSDATFDVTADLEIQSETEVDFDVIVRAYHDDAKRTPLKKNDPGDSRAVEQFGTTRSRTDTIHVSIPFPVSDLYGDLGNGGGDVWITARVFDTENRRYTCDEHDGLIWKKVHLDPLPRGVVPTESSLPHRSPDDMYQFGGDVAHPVPLVRPPDPDRLDYPLQTPASSPSTSRPWNPPWMNSGRTFGDSPFNSSPYQRLPLPTQPYNPVQGREPERSTSNK